MTYYNNNAIAQALRNFHTPLDYARHRYGTSCHRHWWAIAHRARLIDTGEYIKTSEQPRFTARWKTVSEVGPELVNFRGGILKGYPAVSLSCLDNHYLCSGRTFTHTHGWMICQCHCHQEET